MNEHPDMEYHTIRDTIHNHPKVLKMLDRITSYDEYRLFFVKLVNNNVEALDTPTFQAMTHRMLIGGLVMVWSKVYRDGEPSPTQQDDMILLDGGKQLIDALSGLPGTFEAMKSVDWLIEETSVAGSRFLRFPRLMRYV